MARPPQLSDHTGNACKILTRASRFLDRGNFWKSLANFALPGGAYAGLARVQSNHPKRV